MNNKFSIFTICTENYKDAIDFSIPSWLGLGTLDNIFIYTDFDLAYPDKRVIIINDLDKTSDWLKIVRLKAMLLRRFILTYNCPYFCFIDIDCYITGDISDMFNNDFDIAATRMMHPIYGANAGVWFCKNTPALSKFANEWIELQEQFKENGRGVMKHDQSYSQLSYSDILHRELKNKTYLTVLPIPSVIYNNEADDVNVWAEGVKNNHPKVIHFKGRRWRDSELVKRILNLQYDT